MCLLVYSNQRWSKRRESGRWKSGHLGTTANEESSQDHAGNCFYVCAMLASWGCRSKHHKPGDFIFTFKIVMGEHSSHSAYVKSGQLCRVGSVFPVAWIVEIKLRAPCTAFLLSHHAFSHNMCCENWFSQLWVLWVTPGLPLPPPASASACLLYIFALCVLGRQLCLHLGSPRKSVYSLLDPSLAITMKTLHHMGQV